jgi:carbon starvation protein
VSLLVISVWLRKQGRPVVYTLAPMIFVGLATVASMLGEVQGYFLAFSERWLLALMGSLILILDLWVVFEGVRVLLADTGHARAVSGAGA